MLPTQVFLCRNRIFLQKSRKFYLSRFFTPTSEGSEEEEIEDGAGSEPSASAAGPSDAPPAPKRRKRQLSVEEVREKLLTGLQHQCATTLTSEADLFSTAAEMDEVCRKLHLLENQQNRGLIEQNFLIGGVIVEVIQPKLGKRSSSEVSEELQKKLSFPREDTSGRG